MLRRFGILPNIETLFSPAAFYNKLFYATNLLTFKFCTIDSDSVNPGNVYLYTGTDPNTLLRQSLNNAYNDLQSAIIALETNFPSTALSIIFVNGDFRLTSPTDYTLPFNCYIVGYSEIGGIWRNNSLTSVFNINLIFDNGGIINVSTNFVNYITRGNFDIYGCSVICNNPLEITLSPDSYVYINDSYVLSRGSSVFFITYNFTPVNKFSVSYSELACLSSNGVLFSSLSLLPVLANVKVYLFRTSIHISTVYDGRDIFTLDMLDASNFNDWNTTALSKRDTSNTFINFVSGYILDDNNRTFNKFLIWDEVGEILSNSSVSASISTICKDYTIQPADNTIYVCNCKPVRITIPDIIFAGRRYIIVKTYKEANVSIHSNIPIGKTKNLVLPKHIMSISLCLNSTLDTWLIVNASPYLC